jgi:Predicted hydrolases or acyltransferases (alpha/beta hydrolase superfamily)
MSIDAQTIPPRSHFVELATGRFHYLSWGEEHAEYPPALLLHGITSSAQSWTRVGPALADRYRVYALDMRGHGDSMIPSAGNYSLRATACDVLAFCQKLQLRRPLLIGHSWGGATALAVASGVFKTLGPATPEFISTVETQLADHATFAQIVLEDPACHMGADDPFAHALRNTKDIGRPPAEVYQEVRASNPGWSEEDVAGKIEALQKVSREAVINIYQEVNQAGSLLPLLAQLSAPTLLLRADPRQDYSTFSDADWQLAREMLQPPHRTLQIAGASHSMHRSRFAAFMQAVNEFVSPTA